MESKLNVQDSLSTSSVFLGRQPICNSNVETIGYELLFRHADVDRAMFEDGDRATADVLVNTLVEIGLEKIVGPHRAFINFTRNFLLGPFCELLPADRVVLELLENIRVDDQLLNRLRALSSKGFMIALDDFEYREDLDGLCQLADIIKLDLLKLDRKALEQHVNALRRFNTKLLAEKVETYESFDFCRNLGFEYFQGFFFCQPKIVTGKQIPANRIATLRLVAKLQDPEITLEELEEIVSQEDRKSVV